MPAKSRLPQRLEDILLFEDEALLLVSKPAGMASLNDKESRSLQDLAKAYDESLKLCHRLDKNTSGILLMAKGPESYRHLAMQFEHRRVQKTYLTLCMGARPFDGMDIDLPLLVSTNKKVSVNRRMGKPARTVVHSEELFRNHTLCRCHPITGRMHQIRAHLAAVGNPIVGDELYGGENAYLSQLKRRYKASGRHDEEQPINHGYLLHARALAFEHPLSGEAQRFEAPLPEHFETVLKILRKYGA